MIVQGVSGLISNELYSLHIAWHVGLVPLSHEDKKAKFFAVVVLFENDTHVLALS